MCAEDAAFVEGLLDGIIRHTWQRSPSPTWRPRNPAPGRHPATPQRALASETVAGQPLIVKPLAKRLKFHHVSLDSR